MRWRTLTAVALALFAGVVVPARAATPPPTAAFTFATTSSFTDGQWTTRSYFGPAAGDDASTARMAAKLHWEECIVSADLTVSSGRGTITAQFVGFMGQYIQPDPGVYLFNLNPSLYVELPLTITGGTGIYAGAHGEGVLTTYYDASCFALPSRLAGRTTFALSYG